MIARLARRWWSVILIAAAAAAVTAMPPVPYGLPIRADGTGYHIWTYALLRGDLTFSWYRGNPDDACLYGPEPVTNRHVCKYPPGVALVRLPVMALVVDRDRTSLPFTPAEHRINLALGAIALTITAGLGLALAVTAWVNHTMIGRWTLNSYVAESFTWDRPMVWSVLFDPEMGLFPVYPVLAVTLLAGLAVGRSRPFAVWLLVLFLVYAVLYGH